MSKFENGFILVGPKVKITLMKNHQNITPPFVEKPASSF